MKVAFLDLDGTLIDSSARHIIVLKDALKLHGIFYDDIRDYLEYKRYGKSTKNYLIEQLNITDGEASKVAADWVRMIENPIYLKNDILYSDTVKFLDFLKNTNYRIYFLTARTNQEFIKKFIINSGIEGYCEGLFIVNPADAIKEKTEIIKNNMTGKAIVIGDSEVDLEAANNNGIDSYILNRGFRNSQFWNDKEINSYSSLDEIRRIIEG